MAVNQPEGRSFRSVLLTLLLGLGIGVAATLLVLRMIGVPLATNLNTEAFRKFFTSYELLHNQYVQPKTDDTLLNGAVQGMVQSLNDKFTDYFPPTDAKQFTNELSNTYVGIGVTVEQQGNQIVIQSVFPGGPADKAGVKPEDIITAVNGKSVAGKSLDAVSSEILGPKGSHVDITVTVPHQTHSATFHLTRDTVVKKSVFTKMLPNHTGYLQISVVADQTASEVKDALADLHKQGAQRVILDLRGNPGGYVDQAVQIAGDFIPKGQVVVQIVGRNQKVQKITSPGPGIQIPVTVLVDENTASAAEILSAALNEDMKDPLVGTKTYGKGTMQDTTDFSDGSALKYTVAKWLTPHGEWIHGKGIQPTYDVALPSFMMLTPLETSKLLPLQWNQNNGDTATLQSALNALGFTVDRTDGYFDDSTKSAVIAFQTANHLSENGVVDAATAKAVDDKLEALAQKSDTQLQRAEQVVLAQSSGS